MREIKFRAWVKSHGVMITQSDFDDYVMVSNGDGFGIVCNENWLKESDFEIMQYTGLKDSNGKEIYENDIIEYTQHLFNVDPEKFPTKRKEIIWNYHKGSWNLYSTNAGESNIITIGNVYETPELLNK